MTEQEKYIAGQKASGIEVGDTVRVMRKWEDRERGCSCMWNQHKHVGDVKIVSFLYEDGDIKLDDGRPYPHFVLEIVKKNGTVPATDNTNSEERNSDMSTKEQTIFNVAVTENQHEYNGETGLIASTTKKVLYAKSVFPAFTKENAHTQAVVATVKANPSADINWAEVEVMISSPFCG